MVLKRISPSQVELGMYIHSFQGSWFSHPFWRGKFLVEDEERRDTLRSSGLDALLIDTERGRDLAPKPEQTVIAPSAPKPSAAERLRQRARTPAAPAPLMRSGTASPTASGPAPIAREFGNARLVAGRARKVISRIFLEARLGKAPRVAEVAPVVEDIHASIQRNPYAFSGLMRCKADCEAVYQHMLSTSALMVSLARQMRLPPSETRLAGMAGLLLDVGIGRVDIDLAGIAGKDTTADAELRGRHCIVGRETLGAAGDVPEEVLQVVTRHHEMLDGSGFPQGLVAQDIDVFSRMAAICDSYDLLVAGAVTGEQEDPATAMAMLMEMEGALDPLILAPFREALGVYPVGSFVRLRSERIAMVIDQDASDPALPTVRAFYSLQTGKHIRAQTIALAHCYGEDAIEGVADLASLDLPPPEEMRERLMKAA